MHVSKKCSTFAADLHKDVDFNLKIMLKPDYIKTAEGYCYDYPRAAMTADAVIFGFDGQQLQVLLVERGVEPYLGKWALPGGFLHMDETIEECVVRELKEETSFCHPYMKQFGVFSDVNRDPRGRIITTAFYALVQLAPVQGGDDARRAEWFPLSNIPALAFDHDRILRIATQCLREDMHFRPVGFELLPESFTIPQLQRLYEAILGVHFDRRNFMKKMQATGILQATGEKEQGCAHRAPDLYRFNKEQYDRLKQDGTMKLEF